MELVLPRSAEEMTARLAHQKLVEIASDQITVTSASAIGLVNYPISRNPHQISAVASKCIKDIDNWKMGKWMVSYLCRMDGTLQPRWAPKYNIQYPRNNSSPQNLLSRHSVAAYLLQGLISGKYIWAPFQSGFFRPLSVCTNFLELETVSICAPN